MGSTNLWSSTPANLDMIDHVFSYYHTALTGRSFYATPALLHLLTFLSWGDSWTNIISELYCPSWHPSISRACFHPSTPHWACKCSLLHRLTETKARTRACRMRPSFTCLLCQHFHTVIETRKSEPPPTSSEQTPFQKVVGSCSQVHNSPSKLLKPSKVCFVHCTSLTPCPSVNLFSLWNSTAQFPALQRDSSCKGSDVNSSVQAQNHTSTACKDSTQELNTALQQSTAHIMCN